MRGAESSAFRTDGGRQTDRQQPCSRLANTKVVVSSTCYSKLLMHAFKHPTATVNGIILGKRLPLTRATATHFNNQATPSAEPPPREGIDDHDSRRHPRDAMDQNTKPSNSSSSSHTSSSSSSSSSSSAALPCSASASSSSTSSSTYPSKPLCEQAASPTRSSHSSSVPGKIQSSEGGSVILCQDAVALFHTHILSSGMKLAFTLVESYAQLNNYELVGYYHFDEASASKSSWQSDPSAEVTSLCGGTGLKAVDNPDRVVTKKAAQRSSALAEGPAADSVPLQCVVVADRMEAENSDTLMILLDASRLGCSSAGDTSTDASRLVVGPSHCLNVLQKRRLVNGGVGWASLDDSEVLVTDESRKLSGLLIADGTYLSIADFDDHLFSAELNPLNPSLLMGHEHLTSNDNQRIMETLSNKSEYPSR